VRASNEGKEAELTAALHEVGNALTVILGWIEEARRSTPEEARRGLDAASTRARRAVAICRSAIVEDATPPSEPLAELVDEALSGLRREAERLGITVEVEHARAGDELLAAQGAKLLGVLTNLVLNAFQAIEAGKSSEARVRVVTTAEGSRPGLLTVAVTDDGPGIDASLREDIFERGFTTKRHPGGLVGAGVGLAHSREAAESVGGSLTLAESGLGETCFLVEWPVAERPTKTATFEPTPHTLRRRNLEGLSLAVVDDDPGVIELLEMVLGARGAEVASFAEMSPFLRALGERPFDIALLDASPFGAQLEATIAQLRASAPDMALVLISGASDPGARLSKLGVTWLRKPFDVEEVVFVAQTLRRHP
jgi:CheY-like chemotaxis protein